MNMTLLHDCPEDQIINFFTQHWGGTEMVISSGIYNCSQLDGYAFLNIELEIIDAVTYMIRDYMRDYFIG